MSLNRWKARLYFNDVGAVRCGMAWLCVTVSLKGKVVFKRRGCCSLWDGKDVFHCVVGRQGCV